MPDAFEDRTSYLIGGGQVEKTLRYEWRMP
jgi:hypothetical protein